MYNEFRAPKCLRRFEAAKRAAHIYRILRQVHWLAMTLLGDRVGRDILSLVPGLDTAWSFTQGDSRVRVAVLDGPVDLSHPCFQGADLEVAGSSNSNGTG